MEFGVSNGLGWYSEFEMEDAVKHLAEMGWFNMDAGPEQLSRAIKKGGKKRLTAFRELYESLDVKIWQIHASDWDGEIDAAKKDLKDVAGLMKICDILNIPYIGLHPSSKRYGSKEEKQKITQRTVDFLNHVGKLAEDTGVKIVVENMPLNAHRTGTQITELLEIVKAIGSTCIGICLDTSHANASNIDVVEAIHECDSLLWATHISGSDGPRNQHRIPFNSDCPTGGSKHSINWIKVVHALKAVNYQSPFMLEIWPGEYVPPLFIRDLKLEYARKLLIWLLSQ